mgnify:CR=1 FL=1
MIGRDFTDTYIAACGQPCDSRAAGLEHEKHCPACAEEMAGDAARRILDGLFEEEQTQ